MKTVYIEIFETGQRMRIEAPIWITRNRNGIHSTPYRVKAKGIGDGAQIWSFGELGGYPVARIITRAEFEETLTPLDPDPELTAEEALSIILGGSYEAE